MKKELTTIALVGAVMTGTTMTTNVLASEVNCKGVATKWVNDCEANGHNCASSATTNFDKEEFLKMDKADCDAIKSALKNKSVRSYIEKIQKGTIVATKRGKKF